MQSQKNIRAFVFISETLTERFVKLGFALRQAGHKTVVVFRSVKGRQLIDGSFSELIQLNDARKLPNILRSLSPKEVLFNGDIVDDFAVYAYAAGYPVIYNYKDFLWPNYDFVNPQSEAGYASQYLLASAATALLVKDEQLSSFLRTTKVFLKKPRLLFPDYCWSKCLLPVRPRVDAVRSITAPSIAVIAGFLNAERQKPSMSGTGQLEIIKSLLDQGMHVAHYPVYHSANLDLTDYTLLADASGGRYKIHFAASPIEFMHQVAGADFAVHCQQFYHFLEHSSNFPLSFAHSRRSFSGRWSEYLGAGLPIVTDDYSRQGYFAKKAGVGLLVSQGQFTTWFNEQRLEELRMLRRNVIDIRSNQFNIDSHVSRFYSWVNS